MGTTNKLLQTTLQKWTHAIITKSFKKCSISNDLDGTEDEYFGHDKSDTDYVQEMYDDTQTHVELRVFSFVSYRWVRN